LLYDGQETGAEMNLSFHAISNSRDGISMAMPPSIHSLFVDVDVRWAREFYNLMRPAPPDIQASHQ
jgi:hypothetical protein